MAIKAKFKGQADQFVVGIPARDLDEDEYAALDVDQKRVVRSSGLYDVRGETDASAKPAATDTKKGGDS